MSKLHYKYFICAFFSFEGMISYSTSLLAWWLTRPAKIAMVGKKGVNTCGLIIQTDATRKASHPKHQLYTIYLICYSSCNWMSFVNEKISIAGNSMIHCTVIRDSARWKEKICSLTQVTRRETQMLSKCHQACCSCRASCQNVHREFIIFIYFHLGAIITLS